MSLDEQLIVHTDDLGPLIPLPCPDCGTERWFYLKKDSTIASILTANEDSRYSLQCVECEYTIDITKADEEKVVAFLPVADDFVSGRIRESDFVAKLRDEDFLFLKQFARANTNWTCPDCGEGSPLTFPICWSCGFEREVPSAEPEEEQIRTPYLDRLLKDENSPFGTTKL